MPRVCTVCTHPKRGEIDAALVAGEAYRHIAARFGISTGALQRHREHLPKQLVKAQEQEDVRQALDVIRQLRLINGATLNILKQASEQKDGDLALKAVDRIQRQLELQARLLGELNDGATVNIYAAPEWLALRGVMVAALQPYPEAARAVSRALSEGAA